MKENNLERLEVAKQTAAALALDLMLLEMEADLGLMDGVEVESYGI